MSIVTTFFFSLILKCLRRLGHEILSFYRVDELHSYNEGLLTQQNVCKCRPIYGIIKSEFFFNK